MEDSDRNRVLGAIAQANEAPRRPLAPLSLALFTLAGLVFVFGIVFLVMRIPGTSVPQPPPDPSAAQWYAEQFQKAEGPARRGPMFEQLASLLSTEIAGGTPHSESRILAYLGTPDLWADAGPQGRTYVFFYDRFGSKDWAVYLTIAPNKPPQLGFNAANVNPHTGFVPYPK